MSDHVTVHVAQGTLRGRKVTSKSGGSYFSFQGLPYAAPPVGVLRFKAPQPPKSWMGVRDALIEGTVCPQTEEFSQRYEGDEDCLYLNVYTPQLPSGGDGVTPLAVMVYIHGGGFTTGSGNSDIYGPDFLVDKGVVVVTFNYRLGVFGFLSTEDAEIPGNAGMKDQVAALRWVKQNISQFGGDPDNVTIFGESAGGASVHYHLLSPMSRGLFHRAISQSGSALSPWAFSRLGRSRTVCFAKALGCKSEDSKDILAFLREVPAKKLVDNLLIGLTDDEKRRGSIYPFIPTSENFESNEGKFMPTTPIDIIKSESTNQVPYITGVNSNEGLLFLRVINSVPGYLELMDKDFERNLPRDLCPVLDTTESREAAQKIKQFYFGDRPLSQETVLQYLKLTSDSLFTYKTHETVKMHLAHARQSPLFVYQFAFDGGLGMWKKLYAGDQYPGVCHADDLGYLFNISLDKVKLVAGPNELKVRSMLVEMWTTFAKTGKPTSGEWEAASPSGQQYMQLDLEPRMMNHLDQERMQFWDELYQQSKCRV